MKTHLRIFLVLSIFGLSAACNPSEKETTSTTVETDPAIKSGMIKVSVLYPNGDGKSFDMDYYVDHHMKMVDSLAGDSIKAMAIEEGIAAGVPDAPVPYLAMGHMYFESISAFQNTMGPHTERLFADIPNFTNCEPIIQISVVQVAE